MHCHSLFKGIFLTHRSNPNLLYPLHWQADFLSSHHLGTPCVCGQGSLECCAVHGVANSWTQLSDWTKLMYAYIYIYIYVYEVSHYFFKKLKNSILSFLAFIEMSVLLEWPIENWGGKMLLFLYFVVYYFCIYTVVYFWSIHENQDKFMLASTIENGNTICVHYFWKSSALPKHEHCWNTVKMEHLAFSTVTRK